MRVSTVPYRYQISFWPELVTEALSGDFRVEYLIEK